MPKHDDDEPVIYGYASSHNISMRGEDEIGYTWGEWRELSTAQQNEEIQQIVNELVEVYIVDDETRED